MENIEINTINTLFKNVSITSIINSITKPENHSEFSYKKMSKVSFVNIWQNNIGVYSKDEIGNIFENMQSSITKNGESSVFNLFTNFGDKILHENNGFPEVYFEQLLKWQYATRILGQDVFTTAFFASKDLQSYRKRTNFTWSPIIRTDNHRLKKIFEKGIAENHYHLKGSSQVFAFSWISLMNNIKGRYNEFKEFDADINPLVREYSTGENEKVLGYYHIIKIAYAIRGYLFFSISGKEKDIKYEDLKKTLNTNEDLVDIYLEKIIGKIENLSMKSYKIEHKTLDYAVTDDITDSGLSCQVKNLLAGERSFMYNMFKKIYSNDINIKDANLFYLYILIKTKFRTEIIQSNSNIGFRNFANYQDRKSVFIEKNKLLNKLFLQSAVCTPVDEQKNLSHFETRIAPKYIKKEIAENISDIDNMIHSLYKEDIDEFILTFNNTDYIPQERDRINFYTLHFIKEPEKDFIKGYHEQLNLTEDFTGGLIIPRSNKLRLSIEKITHALMGFRENSKEKNRVRGIDACNHEIGCRPEVFAQAFRVLRNHNVNNHVSSFLQNEIHQDCILIDVESYKLGVTYHVGEDFLDLLDGIRAVDEAIKFLDMRSGDRLGHALTLGLNVFDWYKEKDYCVTLPTQDLIDNLCWLYKKMNVYNKTSETSILNKIEMDFKIYYKKVYTDESDADSYKDDINIDDYYNAMMLRADNPFLYFENSQNKTHPKKDDITIGFWGRNDKRIINDFRENELLIDFRKTKKISSLYFDYHFNQKVKSKGSQNVIYKMDKGIIKYIEIIQKKILFEIAQTGIAIETNPTSNYLISTIKRYDSHPIIKFNNLGLVNNFEEENICPQISVSINTDDQGVFDTYLENEYALVALALEKAKDEFGEPKYNTTRIYNWLDSVRDMGIKQSFK